MLHIENREEYTIKENLIAIPQQMIVEQSNDGNPGESLVREIYPTLEQNYRSAEYITEQAILATRNEFVDKLNELMIEKFSGETKTYISFDGRLYKQLLSRRSRP